MLYMLSLSLSLSIALARALSLALPEVIEGIHKRVFLRSLHRTPRTLFELADPGVAGMTGVLSFAGFCCPDLG